MVNRKIAIFAMQYNMKATEFHKLVRANSKTYPVPYHGSKELGTGLERKMRKEMGLK